MPARMPGCPIVFIAGNPLQAVRPENRAFSREGLGEILSVTIFSVFPTPEKSLFHFRRSNSFSLFCCQDGSHATLPIKLVMALADINRSTPATGPGLPPE